MTVPRIALTAPVGPSSAPLVVLGPSLGTSTILWEEVVPLLAQRYRVSAWDLPGHGVSPKASAPFTVTELADAVADVAGSEGDSSILYAGVSLGGAVGLELLLAHPRFVSAAAIVASGAFLGGPAPWHERAAKVRAQGTPSLLSQSAGRWFAPDSLQKRPVIGGRLLHSLSDADDESYALCCEALADYDVRERLAEISAPTLVLWGEHDQVAPESKAEEITAAIQGSRSQRIAEAAHLPPAERPHAVAEALRRFFDSITTRRNDA
ncbi:hypothetical protein GCM10025768_09910 [Microbacterium pseudoresistens]|uniref:3-oxoadipate enol-lactonase n=1 Tax=Microbacterium pseudoresistens TaxID=640634 RepID=A0A7Y9JPQ5_9MICO|nr:alpha/beta fold hydrolase [Microbacterium pseudoresistens]NYD54894.1 3-oxoadipate enol-lactonase [Microbacterium pseudoresistens]